MKPPPIINTPNFTAIDITSKEALPYMNSIVNDPVARSNSILQFGSAVSLLASAPKEFLEQLITAEEANWKEDIATDQAEKLLAAAGMKVDINEIKARRMYMLGMFKAFLAIRPALDEAIKAQGINVPKPTDQ